MQGSIERPLKVLTPQFGERLRVFNQAARTLQSMGIRLLRIAPAENLLEVSPQDGQRLQHKRLTEGYQRHATAGSTRYTVTFEGVTLEWREPISHNRPADYAGIDLTFH
ncbi:hypothetical protein FBY03_111131 [Pseudomonas sp. SJZ079]|uniref:hypothetical protein n=1 Tax=Pseudomonas sp. SJZ079 TaxID=2572887 RepID=UPI0011995E17|nr:hypothetical protein [Pseudomonas sp. SJZ079]TWC35083.1 hypothetical protein FBY03_111131 [Pseudomonas sp. SJZ079]